MEGFEKGGAFEKGEESGKKKWGLGYCLEKVQMREDKGI